MSPARNATTPWDTPSLTGQVFTPPALDGAEVIAAKSARVDQVSEQPHASLELTTLGRLDPTTVSVRSAGSEPGAPSIPRTDLALVRAWARENGYTVADRGRVAAAVLAHYDREH